MYYDALVLSIVMSKPIHGYEIKKELENMNVVRGGVTVSNNTLYPLLAKFEKAGYVAKEVVSQDGKPPRKVYSITEEGTLYFFKMINTIEPSTVEHDEVFFMRLALYPYMLKETRRALIERRRQYIAKHYFTYENLDDFKKTTSIPDEVNDLLCGGVLTFYHEFCNAESEMLDYYQERIDSPVLIPDKYLPLLSLTQSS